MCFYKIRELFLAECKDSFPWKRGGKEELEAAEASLAQQVPGSLNDENMGIGGKTVWVVVGWKQIIGWLKQGRKTLKEGVQGARGASDVRKLLFPDNLQPNWRMNHFFHSSLLPRCYCRWQSFCQRELGNAHQDCDQPGLTSSDTSKQIKECCIPLCFPHLLPSAGVQDPPKEKCPHPSSHPLTVIEQGKQIILHYQRARKYFLNCITVEQKASLSSRV